MFQTENSKGPKVGMNQVCLNQSQETTVFETESKKRAGGNMILLFRTKPRHPLLY